MRFDDAALLISGSPSQAKRFMEALHPGQMIMYNANIEIEIANKGPLDYCLWCLKTRNTIIYFDGKIEDAKVEFWKDNLTVGIYEK